MLSNRNTPHPTPGLDPHLCGAESQVGVGDSWSGPDAPWRTDPDIARWGFDAVTWLIKDPTNNDLRELHQNMQKMLHQSTFEDPRTPPKERALGAARAVAPSPAEAAHEWAEQEKIRASFEQAPEPEDEESPAPTASARKEEKQTRSELIHAALARDCTHKMGPAEKNASALSAIPISIGCLRALRGWLPCRLCLSTRAASGTAMAVASKTQRAASSR